MVSARVEEQHRNCCCRTMRAAVRMYRMVAEEAVAELRRIEAQEGAENAPSRAADGWSVRDLADELLTLQPVDPARCNTRRKIHPIIGGRELECSECWRERVAERLEQWRQGIHGTHPQETK